MYAACRVLISYVAFFLCVWLWLPNRSKQIRNLLFATVFKGALSLCMTRISTKHSTSTCRLSTLVEHWLSPKTMHFVTRPGIQPWKDRWHLWRKCCPVTWHDPSLSKSRVPVICISVHLIGKSNMKGCKVDLSWLLLLHLQATLEPTLTPAPPSHALCDLISVVSMWIPSLFCARSQESYFASHISL